MKNVFKLFGIVALVAAIGFSMAACDDGSGGNNGDGGNNAGGSGLVGKWYKSDILVWEFTSDGKALYAGSMTYTYTATSNTLTMYAQGTFIGTYNYTISGTELTISDPKNPNGGGNLIGTFYRK